MSLFTLPITFLLFSCSSLGANAPSTLSDCYSKINKMKNVLNELKVEQKKYRNVTIENMEIFGDMCIDATTCLESINLPDILRGFLNLGIMYLRTACEDYAFKVGPFSKCFMKHEEDVLIMKNYVEERKKSKCELNDEEFEEVQKIVNEQCEPEALEDLQRNEHRARMIFCRD